MKLHNVLNLFDIYTEKLVVSRYIPYITTSFCPNTLISEFDTDIITALSEPGKPSSAKQLLELDSVLEITYKFSIEVKAQTSKGDNKQLFSVSSEVQQIYTYPENIFNDIKDNKVVIGEFIATTGFPLAWTHWRSQITSIMSTCNLPVPNIPAKLTESI